MSKKVRVNEEIKAPQVRLIDQNAKQLGIVPLAKALSMAKDADLHLVEVSPNAEPPVCKIMDFGRHVFGQKKKQQKPKRTKLKEIKLRPTTDENDYQVKLRSMIKFLSDGNKVKVTMRFRGREMWHRDIGETLLDRMKLDLEPYGSLEQEAKLEGRQITIVFGCKKSK